MASGNQLYGQSMAQQHGHQAPEVVSHDYPEAVPHRDHHQQQQQQQPLNQSYPPYQATQSPTLKHEGPGAYSPSHTDTTSHHPHGAAGGNTHDDEEKHSKRKHSGAGLCGCSLLVFALCCIIALLAAAVIGLAAGTGIEAQKLSEANSKLAAATGGGGNVSTAQTVTVTATATPTTSSAVATSTAFFATVDNNCSGNPSGVTGTTYSAFSLFGTYTFTIQCNKDAIGVPTLSLFAADFNTCMDHCAAYNKYIPVDFYNVTTEVGNTANTTCGGVSFIPLWTTKSGASAGYAPGNCYLKGSQGKGVLQDPNIGTEVHAAVLSS